MEERRKREIVFDLSIDNHYQRYYDKWNIWTILDVHFRWCMWFSVWRHHETRVDRPEAGALCVSASEVAVRQRLLPWGPSRHLESPPQDCDRYFLDHFASNRYASLPRPNPWCANPPRFSTGTTISSETSTHDDFNQSGKQNKDAKNSLLSRISLSFNPFENRKIVFLLVFGWNFSRIYYLFKVIPRKMDHLSF